MRSMATCSVRYSKSKIRGQKHHRDVVINRNSIPNIKVNNKQRLSTSGIGQPVPGKSRPPQTILPLPISRHIITCYVRYQGSKYTVIYIYIYIYTYSLSIYIYVYILAQTIISVQAELEVVRRKHIVHLTVLGVYSSTCCKGTDNCAGTSTVRL